MWIGLAVVSAATHVNGWNVVGTKNKFSGVVFAGLMMVSGAASAATIDFTTNNAPQAGPLTFSNGTDSVDVTAARVDLAGAPVTGTALIASYGSQNGGLGICTSGYNPNNTGGCDTTLRWHPLDLTADSHLVDGYGLFGSARLEMAFLDFGAEVVDLLSITFNYVNDGDTFTLLSDLFPTQTSQTIASGAFRQTFTLTSALRG